MRLALAVAIALATGCSAKSETPPPPEKTRAQKDSAIANSSLPGAKGVGMAMQQAESAKARQARLDSASKP